MLNVADVGAPEDGDRGDYDGLHMWWDIPEIKVLDPRPECEIGEIAPGEVALDFLRALRMRASFESRKRV